MGLDLGPEHERWDAVRIGRYLEAEFISHSGPKSLGFSTAVETALGKIARNPELKEFEQERLLKFISSQGGDEFPLSGLKKDLAQLRRGPLSGNSQQEIVDAFISDEEPNGEIRFGGGHLRQWRGACWEQMDESKILQHIGREYGDLRLASRINDHLAILKGIQISTTAPLATGTQSKINFANGVLDDELQLLPHDPAYGFTYVLPYRYLPYEEGRWARHWTKVFGFGPHVMTRSASIPTTSGFRELGITPIFLRPVPCLLLGTPLAKC
jgi:putative DNA primase/helicase